jgi:hypothetical protein
MIIGIGYRAGSGKDTVANLLATHHGFRRRAFADALKEAARAIFHLDDDQLYGQLKEAEDVFWRRSPRFILQKLGTECLRHGYDPDVWVQSLRRHIIDNPDQRDWVVPDVRFFNEARAIRDWGGCLWRVDRPGLAPKGIVGHASETELDGATLIWNKIIDNGGTLQQLEVRVEEAWKTSSRP